ncbi:MAG: MCE family protein [Actinomycetota bacterium]|nr:MCE family protein [Actinomycetota bacterium]
MVTSRTKKQLLVFMLITLLGVSFVGARYARLDRLIMNTDYKVNAQFADSGGIFQGAEVTYRGVRIGQVSQMKLTRDGVDVVMSIDNGTDKIPSAAKALVGNKSAVGEQYIEIQPKTDNGPYLKDGSTIPVADTAIPISTTKLLTTIDNMVNSVPQGDLRTVVSEMGAAFKGTGRNLSQIVDTSDAFIRQADRNFNVTSSLIQDSNTVLQTQADKSSAIRSFATNLSLFSGTLAGSDADLRKVIDSGSATANQLRTFLQDNQVEIGQLLNNLVTTGKVVVKHLKGIRQVLVIYPYIVEGAYSTVAKGPSGNYDAEFGMILQPSAKKVCQKGYNTKVRDPNTPSGRADIPMNTQAHCAEPASQSSARGAQHAPNGRAGASYRAPVVATYDQRTGKVTWTDHAPGADVTYTGGAHDTFGKDSWKWLLLQPVAASGE